MNFRRHRHLIHNSQSVSACVCDHLGDCISANSPPTTKDVSNKHLEIDCLIKSQNDVPCSPSYFLHSPFFVWCVLSFVHKDGLHHGTQGLNHKVQQQERHPQRCFPKVCFLSCASGNLRVLLFLCVFFSFFLNKFYFLSIFTEPLSFIGEWEDKSIYKLHASVSYCC